MRRKQFWLLKTEPEVFSMSDLLRAKDATTNWDGVRNYQARNNILLMRPNDGVIIYHSNEKPPHLAGVGIVDSEPIPDSTQFMKKHTGFDKKATKEKPIWYQVKIKGIAHSSKIISNQQLKEHKALNQMVLFKNSRLSVQPLTRKEYLYLLKLMELIEPN